MKIIYQGKERETDAATVAAFLESVGVNASGAIIEYKGDVLADASAALEEGAELNVFKIVSGG